MFSGLSKKNNIIYFLGSLLLIGSLFLLRISHSFSSEIPLTERPVLYFITILIALSVVYLMAVNFRFTSANIKKTLFFVFAIGLIIRALLLFSFPVLEDDFNRYLWDGAVTGNSINPYLYAPLEALNNERQDLEGLSLQAGKFLENVNHPHLKTIYPPVSQLVFTLSYKLAPFNLIALKIIYLLFDLVTFFLLLYTFRILSLSPLNILIYWWNPLLLNEVFVSAHFEVLIFPFLFSALLLINSRYIVSAMGALSLAVGVKLWPVFLFPLFLKKNFYRFQDILKPFASFGVFMVFVFLPLAAATLDSSSGLVAYSKSWENNSSVFRIFLYSFEQLLSYMDIHPGHGQRYARNFVAILTVLWVLYQAIKFDKTFYDLLRRSLFIVAVIFLISPTQFPWYFVWMLPFLAVTPRFSLLLLTSLLPLYYLRYYFEPMGRLDVFNNYVVWIEFVPVWILLILEYSKKKILANF